MATDAEIVASAAEMVADLADNPVEEYQVQGMRVRRSTASFDRIVRGMLMLRGITSSVRGLGVAQIERAGSEE